MKKYIIIIYGIAITILIDYLSSFTSKFIGLKSDFFPNSFFKHSTILFLSLIAILFFKKHVRFKLKIPKLKTLLKPIAFGLLVSFVSGIIMSIALFFSKENNTMPISNLTITQILFFVFIYSSIAEELLFRGFLLNIIRPLRTKKIAVFNKKISYSVVTSALMFGLYHIIPINYDKSIIYTIGMLFGPFALGIVAGYYQEKYENHIYAIIIHMSGNLFGMIGMIVLNFNG
ncbi:CPBP family intramembrane glutamic endopeptidase [Lutibacter citreus]|uniref:CPBP family intramembrane glutamic endopeptidase n=1 Tax=Lutibacter citreus TaxID=2138210 RepID=UPI000DBE8CFF|nr:CPBP family intramembrane glutamic endopeptidase [Lutibacter citreus]